MTIGRRAGNRDDPVDGNDPVPGQHQPAETPCAGSNGDQPDGQPHSSLEPTEHSVRTTSGSSDQPDLDRVPRDLWNLIWSVIMNEPAQNGLDRVLRSFARNILFPVIFLIIALVVLVILFESMPHVSLALKMACSALTVAVIGLPSWAIRRKKK